MFKKLFLKLTNPLLTVLVLLYLVLEELVWERIAEPIYQFIHGLKVLQKVEILLQGLNRYAILGFFLLLFAFVEGLSIVAIGFIAQGQVLLATVIYAAKIPIAAFTFWVFRIIQDKLMTFAWFKWCYDGLQTVLMKIKTSTIYINVKTRLHEIKVWVKSVFASAAIRRLKALLGFKNRDIEPLA
ncbi:MAG: hypothetical protein ABL933_08950 [Methyloglobulus sp.]|nr:hypothetical protein [Methyloglobulus sp.]